MRHVLIAGWRRVLFAVERREVISGEEGEWGVV